MLATALEHWYIFDGYAVAHGGADLRTLDVDRLCSYIRWMCTKELQENDRIQFEARLFQPPPGEKPAGPWAPEAETASLANLQQAFG